MFDYPVILKAQPEGGFVATFPDIPEAITQGEDEADALCHAVDALESALSFYIDDRKPLPVPSDPGGLPTVCPSPLESIKLAIYSEMLAQGIRKAELARRLGWKAPQVDRLFDLTHASKIEQMELAAKALGRHINMTLV
ncbi:MAG: type II toxin-antitoxin system HicB family antitoxin [Methylovulum sp.]|uniref:type II toxin-antitoxin system HicB family antitoxin n=1 Tax=Methylovulum sp. TaxID=1916980 RepID=UPI002624A6CF|nr:type II toxin-antitoxin system HicB family antitoxin [Methylovulum sp.]MDD2723858.1 type II toxin-antitoxin system HicB family antitoxin [Methylovulum sp.]